MPRGGLRPGAGRPSDPKKQDRTNKTLRISEEVYKRLELLVGAGRVSDQIEKLILEFLERSSENV